MILPWAWSASKQAESGLKLRAKFVIAALKAPSVTRTLASANGSSPLGELLAEWPETVGALLWPYQCAAWNAETRFDRIAKHLEAVQQIRGLSLGLEDKLVLADLSFVSSGLSLIIDRARWLAREGHLTLSLFKDEFRAFTVSFSLANEPQRELFIGGLQGRQSEGILTLYRDLTKDFEGMRPRDFLLEALRLFAVNWAFGTFMLSQTSKRFHVMHILAARKSAAFLTMTFGSIEAGLASHPPISSCL